VSEGSNFRWWDQDEMDREDEFEDGVIIEPDFFAMDPVMIEGCITDILKGHADNVMAWGGICFREWA
jgi:hypothetical protein